MALMQKTHTNLPKYLYVSVLLSFLLSVGLVSAQQSSVGELEINTETFPQMEVYVPVANPQGYPAEGLTEDNFSILEDGNTVNDFTASLELNTRQELSFILAIDTSGSMNYDSPNTRLENAVNAATDFVESLSDQDQVGLITFGKEVVVVQEITTDHALVTQALQRLEANENTYLYDGLVKAIENLALEGVETGRVIILITDGMDSGEGEYNYENVIAQSIENSVPIYTLGFGDVDRDELIKMATITGGTAQINQKSDDLIAGFTQIMDVLRKEYVLRYHSKLPADNQEHTVSVTVNYLDETYTSEESFTIDTAPRIIINFISPSAGEELSSVQEILVSIDSKHDVEEVVISIDDEVLATLTEEPYSFNWELYSVHNGDYTIKVEARDVKGLTQTEEIVVTVKQAINVRDGDNNGAGGNMSIYIILALFAILVITLIIFGIRKRKQQEEVVLLPPEESNKPVLIELAGRNANKVWQLNTPEIRLGRKSDVNDIPLQGTKASRQMAVIQSHEDQHILYSVKPENPVLVNDIAIQRETILRTGDIITLGESVFRYEIQTLGK